MTYFGVWLIGYVISIGICAADENNGGSKVSASMAIWIFLTWPLFLGFMIGDIANQLVKLNDKLREVHNSNEKNND